MSIEPGVAGAGASVVQRWIGRERVAAEHDRAA